jgi:4-amino-4-deoxy-L-arabinose transferase-like glycosyltransferase
MTATTLPSVDATEESRNEVDCVVLKIAIAALLLARLPLLLVRSFDPDEFEHSHAAWSVFKGLLPYRDFFEHHTPWYYFTLSPFFRWFAVDQSFDSAHRFLLFGRLFSLGFTAISVVLVALVGRLIANRRAGLLAGVFIAAQPIVIRKALEIRPDVAALPFFVGSLWFLLGAMGDPDVARGQDRRWFLVGGLCLGAAVMYTQKMLFALPGVLLGLALWARQTQAWASRALAVVAVLGGVAAPALATWMVFALRHGGGQFLYDNFLLNARWGLRSERHLAELLRTAWPILLLASIGVWRGLRDPARVLLVCTLVSLAVGVAVVPAAYEQYYLPPLAIACLLAADGLLLLVDRARRPLRAPLVVATTLVLLTWPATELARASSRRNDAQLARLRYVFDHTGPAEPVLDGWLGTAVFRPHPLYYFFMHRELWASLPESERRAYLDSLESRRVRPALIAVDHELLRLGPRFLSFIGRDYVNASGPFFVPARAP